MGKDGYALTKYKISNFKIHVLIHVFEYFIQNIITIVTLISPIFNVLL